MVTALKNRITTTERPPILALPQQEGGPPGGRPPTSIGTGVLLRALPPSPPPQAIEPSPEWYIVSYTTENRTFVVQRGLLREKDGERTLDGVIETLVAESKRWLWLFGHRLHFYRFKDKVDFLPWNARPDLSVGNPLASLIGLDTTVALYRSAIGLYLFEAYVFIGKRHPENLSYLLLHPEIERNYAQNLQKNTSMGNILRGQKLV